MLLAISRIFGKNYIRKNISVLIDTNIIISAGLFPKGKTAAILRSAVLHCNICICTYSIEEFYRVVDRKFPENKSDAIEFLTNLEFELVEPHGEIIFDDLPYIRDEKDSPILQAAIAADIEILLTGDKDFCDVVCKKPKIIGPKEFSRLLPKHLMQ